MFGIGNIQTNNLKLSMASGFKRSTSGVTLIFNCNQHWAYNIYDRLTCSDLSFTANYELSANLHVRI